jgi:hypothetical protein
MVMPLPLKKRMIGAFGLGDGYSQPRRVASGRGTLWMMRVALPVQSAKGAEGGGLGIRKLAGMGRWFDWATLQVQTSSRKTNKWRMYQGYRARRPGARRLWLIAAWKLVVLALLVFAAINAVTVARIAGSGARG